MLHEPQSFGGNAPNGQYVEGSSVFAQVLGWFIKFWTDSSSPVCAGSSKKKTTESSENKVETQKTKPANEKTFFFQLSTSLRRLCHLWIPMAFGLGRVDVFAHDHPGIRSDFPLAVKGICRDAWGNTAIACHDLGYMKRCGPVHWLHCVFINKQTPLPGFFLAFIPMYYGPVRFSFDYLRTNDVRYLGLTPAQYGALLLFCVGATVLAVNHRKLVDPYHWKWSSSIRNFLARHQLLAIDTFIECPSWHCANISSLSSVHHQCSRYLLHQEDPKLPQIAVEPCWTGTRIKRQKEAEWHHRGKEWLL